MEASIAMSIASTREITFLSSSLAVFDDVSDILARLVYRVSISEMLSIFASRRRESVGLSTICKVHSEKIGWWSELWSKSSATLHKIRLSESSAVAKIRSIVLSPVDSLYVAVPMGTICSISHLCVTSSSSSDFSM